MEFGVRSISDVYKWRGIFHTHGMLLENVLRHQRLPGLEFQRFADRQTYGVARVHRSAVLGPHSIRIVDSYLWLSPRLAGTGQSVHGVCVAVELVLQSFSVRHTDEAV
jgi:hypothetical protein